MNTVHLHGQLGEQFGGPYQLDIRDAKEAIRAIGVQVPGFLKAVSEGEWRVVRGQPESGQELDEDSLGLGLGSKPLHILPALSGAGDGAGKVILGAAMIGAAFFTGGLSIAGGALTGTTMGMMGGAIGAGMIIAGASMMMAPTPETGSYEDKERNEQSFLFNGPVNVNKQGVAVPLIYGEVVTGSVVISAGIRAEDIPINGESQAVTTGLLEGK